MSNDRQQRDLHYRRAAKPSRSHIPSELVTWIPQETLSLYRDLQSLERRADSTFIEKKTAQTDTSSYASKVRAA